MPFNEDKESATIHNSTGIYKIVYPETSPINETRQSKMDSRLPRDKMALELLKNDMSAWIRNNKRYAVLYLPQIGHAPWVDISNNGSNLDTVSRGRTIIALQDKWLGEILDLLEASDRLNHTIILLIGDHGIRTKAEDSNFTGGIIDPYSFQVPFVLCAPKAIQKTISLPWTTSHIDISPSILDLLGITESRDFQLGAPIWDERLRDRTTFFWANSYLGADGFHEQENYYMWQYISGTRYYRSVFNFKNIKPVENGAFVDKYITNKISNALALQYRISRIASKENRPNVD